MNPLSTLITDHNPSWVGIQWPETPPPIAPSNPSARILNAPDLPHDDETLAIFAHSTDMHLPHSYLQALSLSHLSPLKRQGGCKGTSFKHLSLWRGNSPPRSPNGKRGKDAGTKMDSPQNLHSYDPPSMPILTYVDFSGDTHIVQGGHNGMKLNCL